MSFDTTPAHFASSGDPVLDRRYEWARAAFHEGDAAAAAEILDQTVAQNYGFLAAWHLFGRAQESLGRHEEAAAAWRHCLDLDPQDRLGVKLDLARIGALPAEEATSEAFSGALFDTYADRFDDHLTQSLHYNAPALLHDALKACCTNAGRPFRFATVYDLGCGTGLMGEVLREAAFFLAGCDVSAGMVARADAKRRSGGLPLYDKLAVAELTDFLKSRPDGAAGLVVAADVFVYLGELRPVLMQSARVLMPGGMLAFTVQSHDGPGVVVGEDRRFAHAQSWLRERLDEAGFDILAFDAVSTRQDRGKPVPGMLVVAMRR